MVKAIIFRLISTIRVDGFLQSTGSKRRRIFANPKSLALIYMGAVLCLLAASGPVRADSLTAQVNRTEISEQDTLQFILTQSPQNNRDTPDFSTLEKDFQILRGPSQSSQANWINGDYSSQTEWTLLLMPRRTGKLTIPAFEVGGDRSQAIEINVTPLPESVQNQATQDAFFDIHIGELPAYYVQGEILYTEKLYFRVNHQEPSLTELNIEDARIEPLSDPQRYTSMINGERVGVYERRYAIYPEKAGTLVIPGQRFQALGSRRGNAFDRWSTSQYRLTAVSKPIELEIKPLPAQYPAAPWLPARSLTIEESYSGDPENWHTGEAITRTLRLYSSGMSARQIVLSETQFPNSLRGYPDQPEYEDDSGAEGTQGTFSQSTALVPTTSGPLHIPGIRVPWWNLETDQLEYAELPARDLHIQPSKQSSQSISNDMEKRDSAHHDGSSQPVQPGATEQGAPAIGSGAGYSNTGSTANDQSFSIWWLVATLILLATNGLTLWQLLAAQRPSKKGEKVGQGPQATGSSQALKDIKRACQRNDPAAIRQGLLEWMRLNSSPLQNASSGSQNLMMSDVPLKIFGHGKSDEKQALVQHLAHLDACLFRPSGSAAPIFDGNQFWSLFDKALKSQRHSKEQVKGEQERLYPDL